MSGRPTIGPKIEARLSERTIAEVDEHAANTSSSRADAVRALVNTGLRAEQEKTAYEGYVAPDDFRDYLRSSIKRGLGKEAYAELVAAAVDGSLECFSVTAKVAREDTSTTSSRVTFTTRKLMVDREPLTLYQVGHTSITASAPGAWGEGVFHHRRYLFTDLDAAEGYYEAMLSEYTPDQL